MSATLGAIIKQLQPDWSIQIFESLSDVALESSNPWNNAGTGHSALCELNYTKEQPDGTFDISSAVTVNEQFQVSRQFWSHLVNAGVIPDPQSFINPVPHMSFVWGEENVDYLRRRYEALKDHPLFAGLEFSDDPQVIRSVGSRAAAGPQEVPADRRHQGRRRHRHRFRRPDPQSGFVPDRQRGEAQAGTQGGRPRQGAFRSLADQGTAHGRPHPGNVPRSLRVRRRRWRRPEPVAEVRHQGDPRLRRASRSAGSSCAPTTRKSWPSTPRRSTARPPSAHPRCRSRTSTPALSMARPASCSARTPGSAPSS